MKIKHILLPAMTVAIAVLNTNIASADNGLTFPPENTLRTYQYPPQAPVAPRLNYMSVAPYVYGQNNVQQRPQMIPVPVQANNFRRMPVQPQVMPNNYRAPFVPRSFNGNNIPNNVANLGNFNRNNTSNNFPFSNNNMMPFGNGNNSFNPFSNSNMPFSNGSNGMMPTNPMNNMFGNNSNGNKQNWNMPFMNSNNNNNRKKAWGDKRNIWPDFYTDFTDETWDTVMSGPRDLGRMPGGWRFPYISMPDPVTVSDAITNQFPPIAEEAGNMADFSDWGVFDNK